MLADGGENEGFGKFLSDGLHFSPAGHDYVAEVVFQVIQEYPELAVKPCPMTGQPNNSGSTSSNLLPSSGPYHDEINPKEWEKAFDSEKGKASSL